MKDEFIPQELKPYKGYGIDKCRWIDFQGKKMGQPFYLVSDIDGDYIGEEYKSLTEAKRFIDEIA